MEDLEYEKYPNHEIKPTSLVVLLHGIGADGFDLVPLAEFWSSTLKKTKFYSLHAPEAYKLAPSGRQWFDLEDRDQTRILKEIELVKPIIVNFLEKKLKKNNLSYKDIVFVGFSQGTMVALNAIAWSKNSATRTSVLVMLYNSAIISAESAPDRLITS